MYISPSTPINLKFCFYHISMQDIPQSGDIPYQYTDYQGQQNCPGVGLERPQTGTDYNKWNVYIPFT